MGCSVSGRAGVVCEGAAGAVRRGARPFGAFCAAVLMGGTGGPTLAEETWQLCHGVGWEVTGADPEVRAAVCAGVERAASVLQGCSIPVAPTVAIRVRVLDVLPVSCGRPVYGLFDAEAGEIQLGDPRLCVEIAPPGTMFDLLPLDIAEMALAAHEATHALLYAGGLGAEHRLEHEFIAAVVQFAVLPEADRDALVRQWPYALASSDRPLAGLNEVLLAMKPARFQAGAWQVHAAQPDGCALLRDLVSGAQRLPAMPEIWTAP